MTRQLKINSEKQTKEAESITEKLDPDFEYTKADVVNAVRNEMAQTIEDVLARRTRILFLDAEAAIRLAPKISEIMASELGQRYGLDEITSL